MAGLDLLSIFLSYIKVILDVFFHMSIIFVSLKQPKP